MEKISFCSPEEGTVDLYVLEQTTIGGVNYILVTDTEEGDGEAFILKENPSSDDSEEDLPTVSPLDSGTAGACPA